MGIELYKHNLDAYNSVVEAFKNSNRTAVVHPTGSGKSFIGFKLCEDNPEKRICWLSPSEYIFNMQLESLGKISGGWVPSNISYFTYQSIGYMNKQKIESIKPDYIILDEFHRCGAEKWEYHINRLLSTYPNAKILGLSATEIRYLDNDRNMSDEIFDGNIASYMTLGEAIVRGILKSPKYVLATYAFELSIKKYSEKISGIKNKELKKRGADILNKLRKALEKADGLDDVFKKNMDNPHGKYIVFCSDYTHLKDMVRKSRDWFSKVDESPNIYVAYSKDNSTIKQLNEFNADNSDHLRLLYCIDMFNEGIHIPDVDGVILLRPTVSPIIYKQQIGRALSADKINTPVIFDIVMNIDNLHCVDDVQTEITEAIKYFKYNDLDELIVNKSFTVIDELLDIKRLFNRLEKTINVSWDTMYSEAKKYYETYNNLMVPSAYMTESGYYLGRWINYLRLRYSKGKLLEDQISQLEEIGIKWGSYKENTWDDFYLAAQQYYNDKGNLFVSFDYITDDGKALGQWISNQRKKYNQSDLTDDQVRKLEDIEICWDINKYRWNYQYSELEKYYKEHGDTPLSFGAWPNEYKTLINWVNTNRKNFKQGKLSDYQIAKLDKYNILDNRIDNLWLENYALAKKYYETHNNLRVTHYCVYEGKNLGTWIFSQRRKMLNDDPNLSEEQIEMLDSIGMLWSIKDYDWNVKIKPLEDYYVKYGSLDNVKENNPALFSWLKYIKKIYNHPTDKQQLTEKQISQLENLGVSWSVQQKYFNDGFKHAEKYFQQNGSLHMKKGYITDDGYNLWNWTQAMKARKARNKLTDIECKKCESVGVIWYDSSKNKKLKKATAD